MLGPWQKLLSAWVTAEQTQVLILNCLGAPKKHYFEGYALHDAISKYIITLLTSCAVSGRFATMEGILALVRLYQKFTFTLNEKKHGGRPLEYESLITLMPKVWDEHAVAAVPDGSSKLLYLAVVISWSRTHARCRHVGGCNGMQLHNLHV